MGLDTVELVLQLEDEFCIEIPDRDVQDLVTVDDLGTYLVARTSGLKTESSYDYAISRITTILIRDFDVDRTIIHPTSRIVKDLGLE